MNTKFILKLVIFLCLNTSLTLASEDEENSQRTSSYLDYSEYLTEEAWSFLSYVAGPTGTLLCRYVYRCFATPRHAFPSEEIANQVRVKEKASEKKEISRKKEKEEEPPKKKRKRTLENKKSKARIIMNLGGQSTSTRMLISSPIDHFENYQNDLKRLRNIARLFEEREYEELHELERDYNEFNPEFSEVWNRILNHYLDDIDNPIWEVLKRDIDYLWFHFINDVYVPKRTRFPIEGPLDDKDKSESSSSSHSKTFPSSSVFHF